MNYQNEERNEAVDRCFGMANRVVEVVCGDSEWMQGFALGLYGHLKK